MEKQFHHCFHKSSQLDTTVKGSHFSSSRNPFHHDSSKNCLPWGYILYALTNLFYVLGISKISAINFGNFIILRLIIQCTCVMKNGGKFSINRSTGLNLEGFSLSPFPLEDKLLPGDYLYYINSSGPDCRPEWHKNDFRF